MEKVVLNQEQADAIEDVKERVGKRSVIVRWHINDGEWEQNERPLNGLELDDLIKALYIGYEVKRNFEVGDWIVVDGYSEYYDGKILEITEIYKGALNLRYCKFSPSTDRRHNFCLDSVTNIRYATPEEIAEEKERRWWKKHGREPWKLSLYDCLIKKDGMIPSPKIVTGIEKDSRNGKTTIFFNTSGWAPKEEVKKDYDVLYFASDRKDIK